MEKTALLDRVLAVPMGKMTDDPRARRNVFFLCLSSALYGAAASLMGGEVWSGFLTKTGFSMTQIGFLASVGGMMAAFALLAYMGVADRIQRRIRTYVICILLVAMAPVLITAVALTPRDVLSLTSMLFVLLSIGVGQTLVQQLWVVLDYPIIVRTVPTSIRGRFFAITTVAYPILSVGIGILAAQILKLAIYPMGYAWCFMAASVAILLRGASYSRVRELPEIAVPGVSRSPLPFTAIVDVLKLKEFQWLGPPHILRGFVGGVAGFAMPQALLYLHVPDHYPGYAASTFALANVAGGIVLGLIADRWGAAWTTLLADVVLALGMCTMMLFGIPPIFLVLYFVMHLGLAVEGSSVPLGCINTVPPERMGAFSAARLMVLTGSAAVGALAFGPLFDRYSPILLFGIAAGIKLANGAWFWYVFRLKRPVDLAAEAEAAGADAAAIEE